MKTESFREVETKHSWGKVHAWKIKNEAESQTSYFCRGMIGRFLNSCDRVAPNICSGEEETIQVCQTPQMM